jgi:N,N-dimethylformamidase
MTQKLKTIPLIGYSDRLSVRPGETISFKVSSESTASFTASLFRSYSSDPNPKGVGIFEESAEQFFPTKSFKSRKQNHCPGSYAISKDHISLPTNTSFKFSINFFNTLSKSNVQTLININNLKLFLNKEGKITCEFSDKVLTISKTIKIKNWYNLELDFNAQKNEVLLKQTNIQNNLLEEEVISSCEPKHLNPVNGKVFLAASQDNNSVKDYFNGKLENPKISIKNNNNTFDILADWNFSENIPSTNIKDFSNNQNDLKIVNFPTRGVTGSNWDGSEMSWKHNPSHYGAIHFHEDDIYDFEWENDFSFDIPKNMPSGIYVMRMKCNKNEDNIPFFVCPPKNKITARLCVIIPTFTYVVYGNHARPDYKKSWENKIKEWNAYPHNPSNYKHYGLSTYNFHSDGSGICHASHLRPLLNLKVGYLTFGLSVCSGLRHFQADSHLFSWLHNKDIQFDVLTDQELHQEGLGAIENYAAVMTTSHPEYHTKETLNTFHNYKDKGGNLIYLGGNGFYWKVCLHNENNKIIEIRRAEDGIRAWASEPGEYYNAFDGSYGGLWRRNGIPPQKLTGVGFSAQGQFTGSYYKRKNFDKNNNWIFSGVKEEKIGDFGFSGGGAAGYELDRADYNLGTPENSQILASSEGHDEDYVLVPEEHLTHLTTVPGEPLDKLLRADMLYFENNNGGKVFSTGSITFCGSLPYNKFNNNISTLLENIVNEFLK